MTTKLLSSENEQNINKIREDYILKLNELTISKEINKIVDLAPNLFTLGLNMYSSNYDFNSAIYNSFAMSKLDENISLHKEQIMILDCIEKNNALIISAPTSFGKTFAIFEYIIRYTPQNVILIVPTLALADEYMKKMIKKYSFQFKEKEYKIHINYDEEKEYNFKLRNIFILTHDKAIEYKIYNFIPKIDLLVIDEVYKLKTDEANDRVLILNLAYKYLAEKADKYVLLAPFIEDVEDRDKLNKKPSLYRSNFSPVVNELIVCDVNSERDRISTAMNLLCNDLNGDKNLVYFPKVTDIYKFVNGEFETRFPVVKIRDKNIKKFITWAKNEIHDKWYIVKALERGFLVHNGQLPMGVRMFQIDSYENNVEFNNMICTSTLLEGINISAKNIVIVKPNRNNAEFDAFDFYNLVGRTGRLNKHYLGTAYYIKAPGDKDYVKSDAIKKIKFELTDSSTDIDIHDGNISNNTEFKKFIENLNISYKDYFEDIGFRYRFNSVNNLYNNYLIKKQDLITELDNLMNIEKRGKYYLIYQLQEIIEPQKNRHVRNIDSKIISYLLHTSRLKVKTIVNNILKNNASENIDYLISTIVRLKHSYIEYEFYSKVNLIIYFMQCEGIDNSYIDMLKNKIIKMIEIMYFSNSASRKSLKNLGIYENDIEKIISVIGDDFDDTNDLKERLKINKTRFNGLSFISDYVINNL